MSRTNLYWTDDRDRLNCAHGVILHGTRCIQCERGDLPEPPSFIADVLRAVRKPASFGFDTASGPDRTATGTYQRVGDTMRFTVDDLKSEYVINAKVAEAMARRAMNGDRERMEAMSDRIKDVLRESARGRDYYTFPDPPWDPLKHRNCRSTIRAAWGDGTPMTDDECDLIMGRYRGADIITDPNDHRGVNARKIGESRA